MLRPVILVDPILYYLNVTSSYLRILPYFTLVEPPRYLRDPMPEVRTVGTPTAALPSCAVAM